ncbi:MAG: transposase [Anaerolineales bacterium]|nr:transposase [Anaerolineales bacterium]
MILPPPCPEAGFEAFLKELPEDCLEMAYEFKAFARGRKVRTPAELLRLAMLYCGLDAVLREAAGDFALLRERISDTAVRKRLLACGPWLKALLRRMMPALAAPAVAFRLLAVDSTALTGIAPDGVAFRVHLVLDLAGLALHEAHATGVEGGENLDRHPFVAGDVVLADRGYNHPASILGLAGRQIRVVVRLNPVAMPLYARQDGESVFDPAQAKLDLAGHLRGVEGGQASLAVWLRGGGRAGQGWIHCLRLPPEAAEAARRRCRQNAQRKGRTPGADTLYLAGWVLVFTTVPPGELCAGTVLDVYRARWQIEICH